MMYPYMPLADGTEICHSQIVEKDGKQIVYVHFERPNEKGDFDTARCELHSCQWLIKRGSTQKELDCFIKLLESNAHLLDKYAASGGIQIAWFIYSQRIQDFLLVQ